MKKLYLNLSWRSVFSLIFIIAFSIFLSFGTNFSPTSNLMLGHDCGIFSYVAYAMREGRTLYSEVWENKGPLLYIIYYIGQIINEDSGVYVIELLSILISTLFAYKTIKIITQKRLYASIGVIYTFSMWSAVYEGGTFSENFALPILMIRSVPIYKENTTKRGNKQFRDNSMGNINRHNCYAKTKYAINIFSLLHNYRNRTNTKKRNKRDI